MLSLHTHSILTAWAQWADSVLESQCCCVYHPNPLYPHTPPPIRPTTLKTRPGCAGPFWTILWLILDLIGPYWTNLHLSSWTFIFGLFHLGLFYLDPSIWTCLLEPIFVDPSIWTSSFGPVNTDLSI